MGNTRKTLSFENGEFIASKLKTFDAQLKDAMDAKDAILHNTITEEIHEKITTEANERVKQDNVLHSYIDAETKLLHEKDALLSKEIASFHDELIAEIGFRQAADNELDGKISDEASARETADNELEGKISDEASARETADNELDGKIGSLEDIDDNLSKDNIVAAINSLDQKINNSVENIINGEENGKIDSLKEIVDWITSDNDVEGVVAFKNHVNELDGKISDEASARETTDNELDEKITTEASARESADSELDEKIGSLDDLEDDLSKDNIVAAINSLNTTIINNYTEITNITNNIYEILNGNEDGSEKGLIEKVSDHDSRLDSVEIDLYGGGIGSDGYGGLIGSVSRLEESVSDHDSRLGYAEDNVSNLDSRLGSVEDSVSDLDSRLGSVEERVPDSYVSESDYDALVERVNALEEQIQNLVNRFIQFEELKPTE